MFVSLAESYIRVSVNTRYCAPASFSAYPAFVFMETLTKKLGSYNIPPNRKFSWDIINESTNLAIEKGAYSKSAEIWRVTEKW